MVMAALCLLPLWWWMEGTQALRDIPQSITVTTFWIGADFLGGLRLLAADPHSWTIDTDHNIAYESDSGPHALIQGWVVTARDTKTRALLAVKGSSAAFEALARTPGALPEKPGPIAAK